MMYGYMGQIIRVNLSNGSITKEPLNMKSAQDFVGARGLGTKYFCDEVDPRQTRLTGQQTDIYDRPLTGTAASCSGRFEVVAKRRLPEP